MGQVSSPQYLCDTNIWVKVCLGDKTEEFLKKFSNTGFADVVENEIIKWKLNQDRFCKIAEKYEEHGELYFVVRLSEQDEWVRKSILKDFERYFGVSDIDNKSKNLMNLGEQGSLLYAYHLEIPYIQSDDSSFFQNTSIMENFDEIEILSWSDVVEKITNGHDERIALTTSIENEQKVMSNKKVKRKELNMKEQLKKLQEKYSKR